jgi:hypothetical protein
MCSRLWFSRAHLLLKLMPSASPLLLLVSGASLFLALLIWLVGRIVSLLEKRSSYRLGYLGERVVGEHLQALIADGYHIYHDVPIKIGAWDHNLDHVAIGPHGAAVIETKTRSKPTDKQSGRVEVRFDGKCLNWPRCPNDTKTLTQISAYGEWLGHFIEGQCHITVPVRQVIAIPGWSVNESVLTVPRVVSGRGVSGAVLSGTQGKPELLTPAQIRQIGQAIEGLCRDVID